jgi:hypothetical protein
MVAPEIRVMIEVPWDREVMDRVKTEVVRL